MQPIHTKILLKIGPTGITPEPPIPITVQNHRGARCDSSRRAPRVHAGEAGRIDAAARHRGLDQTATG